MPVTPFVHPWMAASAAALAAVPILIHLLNRRRFRRVVWAAMGFLSAAHRRSARRVRIEQLILLGLRVLIMVLVALALARPLLRPSAGAGLGRTSHHRVIVLDDSYSMGMVGGDGERTFNRAVSATRKLLETFGRSDGVSLVLASRPARASIAGPDYDRRTVVDAIEQCALSNAPTDMAGALALVGEALAESDVPPENRRVYVVTDGTALAWSGSSDDGSQALQAAVRRVADGAKLVIIDVGPDRRDNLAVASLHLAAPVISAEWPATLQAEVVNHDRQEARDRRLQVVLNGQAVRTERVPAVPPGERRPVRFRLQLPEPDSHQVQVRLLGPQPDVLPLDDVRWLSLAVRSRVPVLLVDGRPGADRFSGQTGYLAMALSPETGPADPALVNPRTILTGELTSEPLADHAMIALCNVRQLGRSGWARLAEYVRQGGGLLVYMGDQVSAEDYNAFGFADGEGVLPARIAGLVGSEDDRDKFVRIDARSTAHPCVADFAGQPRSGLFLARFYRHAKLQVPPEADGAAVALRYDNGDCAVAARRAGLGRVAMMSFSANMDWTNLPAKGDYVSLTMGLLAWVAGEGSAARNVLVGEPLGEPLTHRAASLSLSVLAPDGRRYRPMLASQPAPERIVARFDRTDRAGAYRLMIGSRPVGFSVNVDPAEGDLRRIGAQELRDALGCEFEHARDVETVIAAATTGARREIGWLVLWIVLGLLAIEMLLAMRFGHHRG